jgi:hypothetical protein
MKRIATLVLLAVAGLCAAAPAGRPLRDPFARPAPAAPAVAAVEQAPPAPLHLRALVLNGAHSLANIDGDVLSAGDRGPGFTVLRIDARGVLVVRNGRQQLLVMSDPGQVGPQPKDSE